MGWNDRLGLVTDEEIEDYVDQKLEVGKSGSMGYERVALTVTASLSRHNSEHDEVDNARWEELREEIEKLVYKSTYARIDAEVVR